MYIKSNKVVLALGYSSLLGVEMCTSDDGDATSKITEIGGIDEVGSKLISHLVVFGSSVAVDGVSINLDYDALKDSGECVGYVIYGMSAVRISLKVDGDTVNVILGELLYVKGKTIEPLDIVENLDVASYLENHGLLLKDDGKVYIRDDMSFGDFTKKMGKMFGEDFDSGLKDS